MKVYKTSSLCVTAPPKLLDRIEKDLKEIEQPGRQLLLEARVVELETGATEQLGSDWSWSCEKPTTGTDVQKRNAAFDTEPWNIQLGYTTTAELTRSLLPTLTLLEENRAVSVLANPRVATLDGQKATMEVSIEEYFSIVSGPVNYPYTTLRAVKSGIILEVTPQIGPNGKIRMQVSPGAIEVFGVGKEGLPRITRRKATITSRGRSSTLPCGGGAASSTRSRRTPPDRQPRRKQRAERPRLRGDGPSSPGGDPAAAKRS